MTVGTTARHAEEISVRAGDPVEAMLLCAQSHGREEGEHARVTDLENVVRHLWSLLPLGARDTAVCGQAAAAVYRGATGKALPRAFDDIELCQWEATAAAFGLDTSFQYTGEQIHAKVCAHLLSEAATQLHSTEGLA